MMSTFHHTQPQPCVMPAFGTIAPPPHFPIHQPHVNLTYTSLLEVPYERFAEGNGAPVLVSNGTTASYVAPQHLLKTQAFQVALPVYSACPHYTQLGTCMLGASCGLVHTVQLRAPAVMPHQHQPSCNTSHDASSAFLASSASQSPQLSPMLYMHQASQPLAPAYALTPMPPAHPLAALPNALAPFNQMMPTHTVPQPTAYSAPLNPLPTASAAAAYPMQHQMALPALAPLYAPTGMGMQTVPCRDQLAGKALHRLAPPKKIKQRPLKFSGNRQRRGTKSLVAPAAAVGDTQPGPRQLIVNYLAPRVDTAGLRQLFEAFGEVEDALVVTDPRTGASRGFGFVVYKLSADAATAIDAASGRVLLGKRVRIGYLNPQFPVDTSSRLSLTDIAATLEPLLNDDSDMDGDEDDFFDTPASTSDTLTDDVSSSEHFVFGGATRRNSQFSSGVEHW